MTTPNENPNSAFIKVPGGDTNHTAFAPAPPKERRKVLEGMIKAARRIRFLEILGGDCDGGTSRMACVHLRYRLPADRLESLIIDLRKAWQQDVAGAGTGICKTLDTQSGMEFHFAVIEGESYVTGAFVVNLANALAA